MENLDSEIVQLVREHMKNGKQITDEKWRNRLDEITAAYKILQAETNQPHDLPHKIQIDKSLPEWEIRVIACNESVNKSLHPKVHLNIGEHRIELNVEKLSDLRYSVAQLLHRMQHYS
uniref:Uncharacterized protein n=1 Tax=Panagrolaimus sp. PS1159 TaxID=55785 RepID=A0AC35FNK1_9BILA